MNLFEQNLSLISSSNPALAAAIRESGGKAITIVEARNGMPTAMESGRWIHSAYDPQREAHTWTDTQKSAWQAGEVAVVLGIGLLYHLEALCRVLPPEAKIAVVVPDVRVLHDACAARSFEDWTGRVEWVWGSPDEMAAQLVRSGAPLRFMSYTPAARLHADAHSAIETAVRAQVAARASGRLHVAVVGPIYGGSLPIAHYTVTALEALGHRVSWIDHSPHHSSYASIGQLKEPRHSLTIQSKFAELLSMHTLARLAEDPPDLVLALAQAPLTLPFLEQVRRKKFITAMWFVENYRHLTYWQQMAGGYDYWFVIQTGACLDALRHAGAKHVTYLPMAADLSAHRPVTLSPDEQREFGADVSFVGAGYANRRALFPQLLSNDWTFKIWGNEWDGATDLADTIQRQGARIDTETCVKVFNASKINLNLHSCIGDGLDPQADFVNPRTFELAACGAFQLVDQRSLLPALFATNEMAVFQSPDDLSKQIPTWLQDSGARATLAAAARQRVKAEHTYVHRMKELLNQVGMSQPDRIGALLRGDRQADRLAARSEATPELVPLLRSFPSTQRVELKDVAMRIRSRGPSATLSRDELLLLMLDEYRAETRDLV